MSRDRPHPTTKRGPAKPNVFGSKNVPRSKPRLRIPTTPTEWNRAQRNVFTTALRIVGREKGFSAVIPIARTRIQNSIILIPEKQKFDVLCKQIETMKAMDADQWKRVVHQFWGFLDNNA